MSWYGSRWYDPALGRFLSPDPIIPEHFNPLAYDRYQYVYSNPVRYTDSTGHCVDGLTTIACLVALIVIAGGAGSAAHYQFNIIGHSWWESREYAKGTAKAAGDGAAAALATALVVGSAGAALSPMLCGDGDCTNEGLALAREVGKAGEQAAGIIKNTKHIPSASNTAAYRIPDQLLKDEKLLSEVKNVSYQGLTNQLRDFLSYTQQNSYKFELIVRKNTEISLDLQKLIDEGKITLNRLLP